MAKLDRVTAKVFAASAAADEIGQFGSAVAGAKLETADVATIQGLSAWLAGWSEALVSGNRYPALQEMNGLLKVLSYQGAYALQEGIPEYDVDTTYYIGSIVKKTGTFELYGSLTNDNVGNALTVGASWQLLCDLSTIGNVFTADTSNMPILTNNVSDANNDIDFSAGFCYDLTTFKKIINTALTKRLDAAFAAGTNQGGLDAGSKAISTWYHCYSISKADGTADFLFSASATAPTMPTNYVNKRRIGSIYTDSSGNIKAFRQYGDNFNYISASIAANLTSGIPTTPTDLTILTPLGIITRPLFRFTYANGATAYYITITEKDTGISIPVVSTFGTSGSAISICSPILTNNNSIVQHHSTISTANVYQILVNGYIDKRGGN